MRNLLVRPIAAAAAWLLTACAVLAEGPPAGYPSNLTECYEYVWIQCAGTADPVDCNAVGEQLCRNQHPKGQPLSTMPESLSAPTGSGGVQLLDLPNGRPSKN